MLTRASVDWADRIVATRSASALVCRSALVASRYSWAKRATIWRARARRAAGVSRRRRRRGRAFVLLGIERNGPRGGDGRKDGWPPSVGRPRPPPAVGRKPS